MDDWDFQTNGRTTGSDALCRDKQAVKVVVFGGKSDANVVCGVIHLHRFDGIVSG